MGLLSGVGKFVGRVTKHVLPFLLPGGSITSKLVGSIVDASSKARKVGTTWKKATGQGSPQEWENTITKQIRFGGDQNVLEGWQPVFRDEAGNRVDPKTGKTISTVAKPSGATTDAPTPTSQTTAIPTTRNAYGGKLKRAKERKVQHG